MLPSATSGRAVLSWPASLLKPQGPATIATRKSNKQRADAKARAKAEEEAEEEADDEAEEKAEEKARKEATAKRQERIMLAVESIATTSEANLAASEAVLATSKAALAVIETNLTATMDADVLHVLNDPDTGKRED
ncbi:hypothetical protein CHU98_g6552 [Xylaria longipes]|nr:hypothetical protein CHU98_g6552 [Xylaria longipes]